MTCTASAGFSKSSSWHPTTPDALAVQAGLAAFIDSLGISVTRTTDTYDSLVHAASAATF
jgi:hypothetical protein